MIKRLQFITVDELNEILGTCYSDTGETLRSIYEASEICNSWFLAKKPALYQNDDLSWKSTISTNDIRNIKIGVSYQVQYLLDSLTSSYNDYSEGSSISMGKVSINHSDKISTTRRQYSPVSLRYWSQCSIAYTGI